MKVVFAGNPNVGKTSLFNRVTRSFEHVGNYPGVTVERKTKKVKINGKEYVFSDLPGLYSLNARSAEEMISADELRSKNMDVVVVVCEINNLGRNLYLATQIALLGVKTVIAVNMIDELPLGKKFDAKKLSDGLGLKVVPVSAKYRKGVKELIEAIDGATVAASVPKFVYSNTEAEAAVRYNYIDKILEGVISGKNVNAVCALDKIALNKYLALPVFFLIMAAIFYLTFGLIGKFLSQCLQSGVQYLSDYTASLMHSMPLWISALVSQGIICGVGGVVAFLPQVVLLYFFIGLLEDSGYISRVAFMTDDLFGKVGLSGRAAFTLIMGFGCSATAIVTARGLDNKNMRIKTVLLTPFMSCSAKMPVFSAITAAFFSGNPLVIFMLYVFGAVIALLIASLLQKTPLKSENNTFVMEMPPYRMPTAERLFQLMGFGAKSFTLKIGGSVFCLSVLSWVLCNFSLAKGFVVGGEGSFMQTFASFCTPLFAPLGFNWKAVTALIGGLVAKESVISIMGGFGGLANVLTQSQVMPFMVFTLLYVPCVATLGVIAKEIGTKYAVLSAIGQFAVAYVAALIVSVCSGKVTAIFVICLAIIIVLIIKGIITKHNRRHGGCVSCEKCK